MGENSNLALSFHNIDRTEAPKSAVRFLDGLNNTQQVQEIQRLTHRLLGVSEGSQVLDAGCGLGEVTREVAKLVGKTGRVVGVDLSESMVAESRRRTEDPALPVEFRVGDIHHLDFPDWSFDACRSSRVFMYLDDPCQALSELVRLTRPGGTVLLFEPEFDSWILNGPDRAVVRKLIHFWTDQLRNPWIGRQLPSLFHAQGLTDVTVTPVSASWFLPHLETFGLRAVLDKAIQAGVATRSEVEEWLRFMEEAERTGCFFGVMTGLVIRGVKPAT
ncbi:methyltransferase domain-containing protein [Archangium violaceum]|uniref:methyltransferase domain-containing protein n=1 Tax=Archangium violaceum TaxID=83451 RepID=UPI00194E1977|nr:methyltransferase domain-containing protein [Archangium violaceum]QRO00232.1 methyltransferase domain-containing protein [Archangium violaceum]